ncbi:helix-turn-helix transcriptional regulator [Sphingomonas panacisoli]|uniref:Helix-turn-helix transcriptional regulator n=1 Tax=Sphingomonas panacisoli TaxID=1813879 RepID=A0A5B8LJE5_9SPHN|nr:helix-turn-helix transcriptional regulator [Sphingomonas panacisoli]QDZ08221.1 helix-turn-helix transcriptional regulator [Sphingomonas panacisoli]
MSSQAETDGDQFLLTDDHNPFPYRDTHAAQSLADGLRRLSEETGTSLRQLAKMLALKQAAVLSHMANGRMPIPLDRAEQLADALSLDKSDFLFAVLEQRHADTNWRERLAAPHSNEVVVELEAVAGQPLDKLSPEQISVLREVAAEARPRRRWLTVHEVSLVEKLRRLRPLFGVHGVSTEDARAIEKALIGGD